MKNRLENQRRALRSTAFEGMGDKEVNLLFSLAQIKKVKPGEALISQGDTDQTIYVVLDGEIAIVREINGRRENVASLRQGDWIGEIAYTKNTPRTASAVPRVPSSVLAIDAKTLEALGAEVQLALFKRLNGIANERISQLSARERHLEGQKSKLVRYIHSTRSGSKSDYGESELIRRIISKIPKLPAFANELVVKLHEENVSANEVSGYIKEDPSLGAIVLKTVNSSYFGLDKKISDIHHAVVLLGFVEIYQLLLSQCLRHSMPDTPEFKALHAHSVAMSHLAFSISQVSRVGRPVEMATIGLLHDLGRSVVSLLREKTPGLGVLIESLDHSQIGTLLLREWNIPEVVCQSVGLQHHPEFCPPADIPEEVRNNIAGIYLAHLCHDLMSGFQEDELPTAFLDDYLGLLGWEKYSLEEMLNKVLLPNLTKKLDTYPASFKELVSIYIRGDEPETDAA